MGFLNPISLLFAALSIPILIMYMLKLRRRDVLVSSTLLWQRLLRDREANAPWQRLRRNLLLLLQLLILALMTVALARPFVPAPAVVSGSVVVLLDSSASMQARDVAPSRFEAARRAAREVVSGLGAGDVATVIAVGPQPRVLVSATGDRAALRRALDEAVPSEGVADWEAAFALAGAGMSGAQVGSAVVISDGALPQSLPPLPGEVRLVRVGGEGDNLAVAALATREGAAGPQAFLRVVNYGNVDGESLIEFTADGTLFDARRLRVPAHGSADLTLTDLPYGTRVLEARLAAGDALALDDAAWAMHTPSTTGRVLLVSRGNLFLERALGALPGVELVRLLPDAPVPPAQEGTGDGYDLTVYDGVVPGAPASGNLWIIGPPASLSLDDGLGEGEVPIRWGGIFTATAVTRVAADDPLLRYVDLRSIHVRQARRVEPPPGSRVLVEAEGGPLLLVADRPEGRLAVLTFDLRDSDLPLQIAFPVLTANLVDWLVPGRAAGLPELVRPGDPVPIQADPEAAEIVITAPDGARHVLPASGSAPVFASTGQLGRYDVEQLDRSGELLQSAAFAVNLFDEEESNIAPRETVLVGQAAVTPAAREQEGRREFWPWLACAALGILTVEWWAHQRGGWGDGETRRQGEGETRGRGDKGTGRQGDRGMGGQGDRGLRTRR